MRIDIRLKPKAELPDHLWEGVHACAAQLDLPEGVCPTKEQYREWQQERQTHAHVDSFRRLGSWEEVALAAELLILEGKDVRPELVEQRAAAVQREREEYERRQKQASEVKTEPFEGSVPVRVSMTAFGTMYVKADSVEEGVEILENVGLGDDVWMGCIDGIAHEAIESMERQY